MSLLETKDGRGDIANAIAYMDAMGDELALWYAEHKPQTILDRGKSPDAIFDVSDPAKLAEMIAVEARRCGLEAYSASGYAWGMGYPKTHIVVLWHESALDIAVDLDWRYVPFAMARTILAALLQLPDGAREQAERILRGET